MTDGSDMFGRDLIKARLAARQALASRPGGDHVLNPDFVSAAEQKTLRPASVLVPLVDRPEGLSVLFTRRSDQLQAHAGQVSFPGGSREADDADAIATALRETEEEIGLLPRYISVAGLLNDYVTGTGFRITPVVGIVTTGFDLRPDPLEVAEIFEVPLAFLMDPRNHARERVQWKGAMREYYAMPYNGHYIWGATAGMLVNFYETLRGEQSS